MIIKKVLNNNAVISSKKGIDVLIMGKGIAFSKKTGNAVDNDRIERIFILRNKDNFTRFTEMFISVPIEIIYVCEKIINLGKIKLGSDLDEIIYINLTDHINSSIERQKNKIFINNPLRWEISKYYPDEYKLGEKALEIIYRDLNIRLNKDEAAFIALHFVNANMENNFQETYKITKIISNIEKLVKNFYKTELDQDSVEYYRFITHIKLFAHRLIETKMYEEDEDGDLLELMKKKYPNEYQCSLQVAKYIFEEFSYKLNSSELLYLTAHIRRMTKHLK
ncbi:BglG family transcription antiterminator LicT [Lactococcus lactis]|uniref:Beta-glucoside bgl operon antiterminator BglG family n=1 Tax=Lactococcus lactis subsp. lactis TaxID=1360 RepID=A0A0V8CMJ4_LACLL|nr:PRD domain-containing protein [Lactococcus lactis]KSU02530.1 Beta-glucoside bgl operon antiterminator BglG family [Lactococcus lactis subsp. lactis]WEA55958.1 PRD domain-containing protein [Lactococcus lactis]BDH83302.1 transcription antiterminator BglG [Lactococcus lactis]